MHLGEGFFSTTTTTTTFHGLVLLGFPIILGKWILTPRKRNLISLVKLLISHWIPNCCFSCLKGVGSPSQLERKNVWDSPPHSDIEENCRQAHCSGVPPKTLKFFWKYPSETKSIPWKSSRPLKNSHLELLIINPFFNNVFFQKTIYLMVFGPPGKKIRFPKIHSLKLTVRPWKISGIPKWKSLNYPIFRCEHGKL